MSRRKRARREAIIGVVSGAVLGAALWDWTGVGNLVLWAVPSALFCAMLMHHGEYMGG